MQGPRRYPQFFFKFGEGVQHGQQARRADDDRVRELEPLHGLLYLITFYRINQVKLRVTFEFHVLRFRADLLWYIQMQLSVLQFFREKDTNYDSWQVLLGLCGTALPTARDQVLQPLLVKPF